MRPLPHHPPDSTAQAGCATAILAFLICLATTGYAAYFLTR